MSVAQELLSSYNDKLGLSPEQLARQKVLVPKIHAMLKEMDSRLLFNHENNLAAIVNLVANGKAIYIGAPGTGKSLGGNLLQQMVGGKKGWIRGMHPTLPLEAVIGFLDTVLFKKDGTYRHKTETAMPGADMVQFDEFARASTVTFDALMTALNERFVDNGENRTPCQYVNLIATSNDELDGEYVAAMNDRFDLKIFGTEWSPEQWDEFQDWSNNHPPLPPVPQLITLDEVKEIQDSVRWIPISAEANEVLKAIRRELFAGETEKDKDGKIRVVTPPVKLSPRRLESVIPKMLRAYAFFCGDAEVDVEHFYPVLRWCCVNYQSEVAFVEKVIKKYLNTEVAAAQAILEDVKAKGSAFTAKKPGSGDANENAQHDIEGYKLLQYFKSAVEEVRKLSFDAKARGSKKAEKLSAIETEIVTLAEKYKAAILSSIA